MFPPSRRTGLSIYLTVVAIMSFSSRLLAFTASPLTVSIPSKVTSRAAFSSQASVVMKAKNSNNRKGNREENRRSYFTNVVTKGGGGFLAGLAGASFLSQTTPLRALAEEASPSGAKEGFETTASGIQYKILKEGTGGQPTPGVSVQVHYSGWLDGFDGDGRKFDSSYDRRRPFVFKAGVGQVIGGWDQSVLDMKVGEKRNVIIPPELGYGARGAGGVIPPNATLYFTIELLAIK